jgi:DNA helicase HerA-like ATPase
MKHTDINNEVLSRNQILLKKFYKNTLSSLDIYSSRKFAEEMFGKKEIIEKPPIFDLKKEQVLVGFKSPKFDLNNAVTLDLRLFDEQGGQKERKSRIITIFGDKGDGKSVLASVLMDYFIQILNIPILIIDPNDEYSYWKSKPFLFDNKDDGYKSMIDEFLGQFGLKRTGYKTYTIAPKFLGEKEDIKVDKYYSFSFKQFKKMMQRRKDTAVKTLTELLGIADDDSNIDFLLQVLESQRGKFINSWDDLKRTLLSYRKHTKVKKIFSKLNVKILTGVLSDNEENNIDICELLSKYQIVVFSGEIRTESDDTYDTKTYNAFIKILFDEVRDELKRLIAGVKGTKLTNKSGVLIYIDEADSIAPKDGKSSLKTATEQLATKRRKDMLNVILITQVIGKLDEPLVVNSDYLFTSALNTLNEKIFKEIRLSDENINLLAHMRKSEKTSIGTIVRQWGVVDKVNTLVVKKFYPICPASAFKRVI